MGEYPKNLTQEEFESWFLNNEIPLKIITTQINEDILLIRKIL